MAPTIRQRRVAKKLVEAVENGIDTTAGEIVESSRYSKSMAIKPGVVIQSKGVQEALEDLGFTIDGADSVVKKILYKSKREDMRLRAADMVYKRRGAYEDTKQGAGKTLIVQITQETAERYGITPTSIPEDNSTGQA